MRSGGFLEWGELPVDRKCVQGEVAEEAQAASQALRKLPWQLFLQKGPRKEAGTVGDTGQERTWLALQRGKWKIF